MAYVSLPPGALAGFVAVTIRNRRTGDSVAAILLQGGLDPVPVPATAGDTLELDALEPGGAAGPRYTKTVPPNSPPIVVRTDPPPGKRDVPLNSVLIVVVSKPLDTATVTSASVQLFQGGQAVSGTAAVLSGGLRIEFAPDAPLVPQTTYVLEITTGIADVQGNHPDSAVAVTFTSAAGPIAVAGLGRIAFVSTRDGTAHIYVMNSDGSGVSRLTSDTAADDWPAWSPDGSRIAFSRSAAIWIMNADGAGLARLADGTSPSWSPDGAKIAFARDGIYSMNADGSGATRLTQALDNAPAWSADGRSIAYEHTDTLLGDYITQVYVMNADGSGAHHPTWGLGNNIKFAESSPSYSRGGTRIAFWSYGFGVAVSTADGSSVPFPVGGTGSGFQGGVAFGATPDWAPDDSRLVYTVLVGSVNSVSSTRRLVISMADGSSSMAMLGSPNQAGEDFHAAWSRQ